MPRLVLGLLTVALHCGATEIPEIDTSLMEPQVKSLIDETARTLTGAGDSADAWGKLGQVLHAHERFSIAITCYDEAMRLDPNNFRWPYLAGHAAHRLRQEDAVRYFDAAGELATDNEALYVNYGNLLLRLGRSSQAQDKFRQTLTVNPESAVARVGLSRASLVNGDLDVARRLLEEARQLNPHAGDIHTLLAQVYSRQGDTGAAALAELSANIYPDPLRVHDPILMETEGMAISANAYAKRGQDLADVGDLNNAETQLRKVLTLRDATPDDYGNLATVLSRQNKYQEALDLFEKGLSKNPDNVILLNHRGLTLLDARKMSEAEVSLRKATSLDPAYAEAHFNFGVLRFRQQRFGEAADLFQRALTLKPGLTDAYINLGSVLAAAGDLKGALEPWQQLKSVQPNNIALIYNIGLAYARLGNFREAIAELQTGLTLAPDDLRIVATLARALVVAPDATLRDGEQATVLSQQLTSARPADPGGLELLAAAMAETGKFEEAIDVAERGLSLSRNNPTLSSQLRASIARYRQGKTIHD